MGRSGTGLGLTLVWNTVQDHDGYIDVRSDGAGTTFELYFPITRSELSVRQTTTQAVDLKGAGELILIVDDVAEQRTITTDILQKLGYQTAAVSGGKEAVAYLKQNPVDLVLLDMIMDPGIDGCQTDEEIIKIHPGQKAVIVSGYAETDLVKKPRNWGLADS